MRPTIAYRLTPVKELEPGGIGTAAVMTCMASGRLLSGMGGGGMYLAPDVVEALRASGVPRAVCDAVLLEDLMKLARRAAEGEDVAKDAASIIERSPEAFS